MATGLQCLRAAAVGPLQLSTVAGSQSHRAGGNGSTWLDNNRPPLKSIAPVPL